MPAKIARLAAQPPFGLPEVLVAVHTSRLSCRKAGKAQIFAPVWESSGESRLRARETIVSLLLLTDPAVAWAAVERGTRSYPVIWSSCRCAYRCTYRLI